MRAQHPSRPAATPQAPEPEWQAHQRIERPQSISVTWINWTALASFLLTLACLRQFGLLDVGPLLVTAMLSVAVPIIVLERLVLGPRLGRRRRASDPDRISRCAIKLVGLVASLSVLALSYWVMPYFRFGDAALVLELFQTVALPLIVIAPIYIAYVDARMPDPEDEYYAAGLAALGRFSQVDREKLARHARAWLVKIFFFQYITSVFLPYLDWAITADIWSQLTEPDFGFMNVVIDTAWMIDVAFSCIGYFATLRLFDTHVRSTEPTMLGWVVCMLCYGPFYAMLMASWLPYEDGYYWGHWLAAYPAAKACWAVMIVVCLAIYASATVQFGLRFSNLTHRGIITNGPFRLTKHPQYIFKNTAWWLISVPFIHEAGAAEAIRHCLMLLGFNFIFFWRAKTEERHLSQDPVYRQYAAWIAEHGLFARLKRAVWGGRPIPIGARHPASAAEPLRPAE